MLTTNRVHPPSPYQDAELARRLFEAGIIRYCGECDRYFDVRCGCDADIRFDERARIRRELLAWADDFVRRGAYMDGFREALDRICPEE